MNKPEDIPQDVWDKGRQIDVEYHSTRIMGAPSLGDMVARAIMAAKAEEREACAVLADCNCSNPWCERQEIADAIRKRGEPI